MATTRLPFSRRTGNSAWRWSSFGGKSFSSERSTWRFLQIDVIEADFFAERFEHGFFGAVTQLHGGLLHARAVLAGVLRSAHFGNLVLGQ